MCNKIVHEATEELLDGTCTHSNRNTAKDKNILVVPKKTSTKSRIPTFGQSNLSSSYRRAERTAKESVAHEMCHKIVHDATEELLENTCANSNRNVNYHSLNCGTVSKSQDKKNTPTFSMKSRIPIRGRSILSNRCTKDKCIADGGVVQKICEEVMPEAALELDGTCSHSNDNTTIDKKNTLVVPKKTSTKSRIPRPGQLKLSNISRKTERTAADKQSAN
jgi:hypothetical protein